MYIRYTRADCACDNTRRHREDELPRVFLALSDKNVGAEKPVEAEEEEADKGSLAAT